MKKILPNIRQLCVNEKGQNYWFNGCMEYLMECLGEDIKVYDYYFFSNVTGDSLMQLFSKDLRTCAYSPSDNVFDEDFARRAFDACGYEFEYITNITDANRADFIPRIKASIDKGIPVINMDRSIPICGYDGDEFYYLVCNEPIETGLKKVPNTFTKLIFVGAKKEKPPLREVYKKAVMDIPSFITRPSTDKYSFGKQAFVDWAESFQNGTFDDVPVEKIGGGGGYGNAWLVHGTYLCMAGTNGCADDLLWRAKTWNPDMEPLINELLPLYKKHQEVFHDLAYRTANGETDYRNGGMNGGFRIKPETIKDKSAMKAVSEKIMESAKVCDEILAVFEKYAKR